MSENFESGLRDLYSCAAQAHAGGTGLPEAAMVGRARRNRRVRAAGVSVATVAAVVGGAFGGVAAVGHFAEPAPVPPAVTASPSPTATPYSPTTCGGSIADVPVFPAPPTVNEMTLDRDTFAPGEPLTGRILTAVEEVDNWSSPGELLDGWTYAAVQDGVVVGFGSGTVVQDSREELSGRFGLTALVTVRLIACHADVEGGSTLAAGDYELYGATDWFLEGDPIQATFALGGPWPFTITETGADTEPAPDAMPLRPPDDHFPASGASASSLPAATGGGLEDGDYFGFVRGIDLEARQVDVDIAIFYTGQAAIDYLTANEPGAENPPPNDYYIASERGQIRTLTVADDAVVWSWCFEASGDLGYAQRTFAEWVAAPVDPDYSVDPVNGATSCDAGTDLARSDLAWIDVRDGKIRQLIGPYLP